VDERSRQVERRLELPLMIFALLTIPAIALEYADTREPWNSIGIALNWTIWLAFVAEVVIMLRVVPDRRRWLRDHPLDLAIVILTPPFLPPALQAARVFRVLLLLRLVRAGTLVRRVFSTEGAAAERAAEDKLTASKPAPSSSDWHGYGAPNVQRRVTADGSELYRGRVSGKASPTYQTEADATAWVEAQKATA
jgi:hypothetical protein